MAGMLPGVETARRRRIHQRGYGSCGGGGGGWSDYSSGGFGGGSYGYTRRPVSAISAERSDTKRTGEDEMEGLGGPAREAKERLDERLRSNSSSLINRSSNDVREGRLRPVRCIDGRMMMVNALQSEVFGSKKKLMLLRWASRLGGKKATEPLEEERVTPFLPPMFP